MFIALDQDAVKRAEAEGFQVVLKQEDGNSDLQDAWRNKIKGHLEVKCLKIGLSYVCHQLQQTRMTYSLAYHFEVCSQKRRITFWRLLVTLVHR